MRKKTWVVAAAVALAGLTAPGQSASAAPVERAPGSGSGQIVYVCGANLCTVDPDTGKAAQLTTDGVEGQRAYSSPSVSADGSTVAAQVGTSVVVGPYGSNLPDVWVQSVRGLNDVQISPDGASVSTSHFYSEIQYVYCYPYDGCLQHVIYRGNRLYTAPGAAPVGHMGGDGTGFLGGALLSVGDEEGTWVDGNGNYVNERNFVCTYDTPAVDESACTPRAYELSPQAGLDMAFHSPAGSPDGTLVAAVLSGDDGDDALANDTDTVVVYDAATGVRVAAMPGLGYSPAFSPDSSRVVWQGGDGWLYVAPARGGTPVRLVQGTEPAWANVSSSVPPGAAGQAKVVGAKKALRVKRRAVTLKVACASTATGPCTGTVRLSSKSPKRKPVMLSKSKKFSVAPGKTAAVRITLTRRGVRVLAARKVTKATALLTSAGTTSRTTIRIRRP